MNLLTTDIYTTEKVLSITITCTRHECFIYLLIGRLLSVGEARALSDTTWPKLGQSYAVNRFSCNDVIFLHGFHLPRTDCHSRNSRGENIIVFKVPSARIPRMKFAPSGPSTLLVDATERSKISVARVGRKFGKITTVGH